MALRYRARNQTGEWSLIDPYSFGPVLGPMDDYYVAQGTHLQALRQARRASDPS